MDETLHLVERLKRKLSAVTADGSDQDQEAVILKILKKLSFVSMSIEILKVTQIGKQVNNLRKWGGKVSSKSKSIVKKWKQLLQESDEPHGNHSVALAGTSAQQSSDRIELRLDGDSRMSRGSTRHVNSHSQTLREATTPIYIDSEEDEVVIREVAHSKKKRGHCSEKESSKKRTSRRDVGNPSENEFSRALAVPLDTRKPLSCASHGGSKKSYKQENDFLTRGESSKQTAEMEDVICIGSSPTNDLLPGAAVKTGREKSPKVMQSVSPRDGGGAGLKRRVPLENQEVVIAQSKRSRTQVYSGKKTHHGPQEVTSLFDLCMKILIDNIDVIEEVGPGVPYHVLEPLLLKCTAVQLMNLEKFNPHLIEDTDKLWKKHVFKDFKEMKLPHGTDWREFYREKLAEREEKLKNLTARIRANHAKDEPVRKMKLAEATMKPGRRSGLRRSGGCSSRPLERPYGGCKSINDNSIMTPLLFLLAKLMKRTLKMAKERYSLSIISKTRYKYTANLYRNHMMTFKPAGK